MSQLNPAFISREFLISQWDADYRAFQDSPDEVALFNRLSNWAGRTDLKERSAEAAFIQTFFEDIWGYHQDGRRQGDNFTAFPQFNVPGAGAGGNTGAADLALGWFGKSISDPVPQVLCEFKDIRSNLDALQKGRKGSNRSPVQQCLDYLGYARRRVPILAPIVPEWGIVTDMNEFRLYWQDRAQRQYLQFSIRTTGLFSGTGLITQNSETARVDRFLFSRIFHADTLLTRGGPCLLRRLIENQRFNDRKIENQFYEEYRAYREHLYQYLLRHNGPGTPSYPGTNGRLVRLAQKILDRLIFVFFCEDMGNQLDFTPKLLRDLLTLRSNDPYYDRVGFNIWDDVKRLFSAMNDGSSFGNEPMNRFNGGLFAEDPQLDKLRIPNHLFAEPHQGANEASLSTYRKTVLYLCATYNFAADLGQEERRRSYDADDSKRLGLYMLGRIFEQSITELEILEADADNRTSVNKSSKRKRDGVYYTPEWVVERIVEDTLGPRLAELKADAGWKDGVAPNIQALEAYEARLKQFTVVDPACGSGAFLITALRYLLEEWKSLRGERTRLTGSAPRTDDTAEDVADILKRNIYGVDINSASVEIARLALWLHTARRGRPLSGLEDTIREGNSLIGPDYYNQGQIDMYDEAGRERINAFDWRDAFPQVFERGGFDAVIGNPPYVKLQNFRAAHPDMAAYLRDGRGTGAPYQSTANHNFDLYLPFIEKGLKLLNARGRLGYIAPSLWIMNDYGEGLRNLVAETKSLDRWVDFKHHQIFDEATIYTALQYFTAFPNDHIRVLPAPDGEIRQKPWDDASLRLPYGRQIFGDRWLLLTGPERDVIDALYKKARRLDDPAVTTSIFQGLITSADSIYHLRKLAPGRYLCMPQSDKATHYEVMLEDAIMKPLVSGPEAKRYVAPRTDTYLLFPYRSAAKGMTLIPDQDFAAEFPKAWAYLKSYEKELRGREHGKMDHAGWYGFGRTQNLDKQDILKLIVAQTVPSLRITIDPDQCLYLNNVRVNGIVPADDMDPWFLLGVLNSNPADFVFRRIGKVKDAGWFEANKQFIAPLPIPRANTTIAATISESARRLFEMHSQRRDLIEAIERRLSVLPRRQRPIEWLMTGLPTAEELAKEAPARMKPAARNKWVKQQISQAVESKYAYIDQLLNEQNPRLSAELKNSDKNCELVFKINELVCYDRIFVSPDEGRSILAQWLYFASTVSLSPQFKGEKLSNALRSLVAANQHSAMGQFVDLTNDLVALDQDIKATEANLNQHIYDLHGLSPAQIAIIETG